LIIVRQKGHRAHKVRVYAGQ